MFVKYFNVNSVFNFNYYFLYLQKYYHLKNFYQQMEIFHYFIKNILMIVKLHYIFHYFIF